MKTCLVVDDSSVIRKVARRILEGLEFEISEAEDGEEQQLTALGFGHAQRIVSYAGSAVTGSYRLPTVRPSAAGAALGRGTAYLACPETEARSFKLVFRPPLSAVAHAGVVTSTHA